MVAITYHGADCCGVRHISGFRDGEDANIQGLIRALNQANMEGAAGFAAGDPRVPANGNLLLEVILSNRQTQQYPNLMRELARLGFVYDASWTGQHGTPVHRFSRARRRLRLADNEFRWAGMVMGPNVGGDLPVFREGGNNAGVGFEIGAEVEYTGPAMNLRGRRGIIAAMNRERYNNGVYTDDGTVVRWTHDNEGDPIDAVRSGTLAAGSLTLRGIAPPAPIEYRHPRLGNGNIQQPPPAPVAGDPRPILNELFAVFRDGRVRGPFTSMRELSAAYPRVTRYKRRLVYRDGRIVDGEILNVVAG